MKRLENIRNQSFPSNSIGEWKEKAEQSLKGKTVENLQRTTYENIILKPLYSRGEKQMVPDYPGGPDLRRGIEPLGYLTNEWKVAQCVSYQTPEELSVKLGQSVEKGQSALSFEVTKELLKANESWLGDLYRNYPFAVNSKWLQADLLEFMIKQCKEKDTVTGYVANDPLSLFAQEGFISEDFLQNWSKNIKNTNEWFPQLRTVLIDTTPYHNGGANAVQELGIAIAEGVFYLQQLLEEEMSLDAAFSKLIFQFSIGSNFFMEVAKLRAARIIWNRVSEVYGVDSSLHGMQITASTSSFTKTLSDPHVNLLRTGNEAFAAVIGGIQYLQVAPFDELTGSTNLSERISRNIQLILKEEAHLQKVIDPAGGSWYVEELTNQLAEKAWEFFQQIETNGGILEALKSNWIQKNIAVTYTKRNLDIQTRKQSIIGTNVYANPDEVFQPLKQQKHSQPLDENSMFMKIEPLPNRRLSEPFEELRMKARKIEEQAGVKPSVAFVCLGELKQYKARLDFMKGFVAAGGIQAVESNSICSIENARQFIREVKTNFVCFCGTNEKYEEMGHDLLPALKTEFPKITFFLAGLPETDKQHQWLKEGIQQFIHVKSNCYETLTTILSCMEVTEHEETKA